jgi:hypothetical protein
MEYRCKVCEKVYASYQSLWNHNRKIHTPITANITQNTTNVTQNTTKLNKNSLCIYCNKCFSRNDSLKRHQLKCCKKYEDNLYKQQIQKLTDDLEKLKHKMNKKSTNKIINYNNNTVNNTVNNNLTNINNIGAEKITDLTRDEKKYIMSHGMNSIISLAEHLNFNERLPQNHNFYVSALNDKHLNAIDNNTHTIVKQRKKEIFDQILVAHIDKLEKINTNINYKDFSNVLTKLKNFIFLKQGKKEYFSQLNMLAYNKKNLIIKTWDDLVNDDSVSPNDIAETFQKRIKEITNTVESESDSESDSGSDSDSDSDSEFWFSNKNK